MNRTVVEAKIIEALDEVEALLDRDNKEDVAEYMLNEISKGEKDDFLAMIKVALCALLMEGE